MAKIDNQMLQKFQSFTGAPEEGKQVSQDEARVLMGRAQILNKTYTGSCTGAKGKRGNKSLDSLVHTYPDKFSVESKADINYFIKSGRMPQMAPQGFKPIIADSSSSSMAPKGFGGESISSGVKSGGACSVDDSTTSSSSSGFESSSTTSDIAEARRSLGRRGTPQENPGMIISGPSAPVSGVPNNFNPASVANTSSPVGNINSVGAVPSVMPSNLNNTVAPNVNPQPANARPANNAGNVANNANIGITANPRNNVPETPNAPVSNPVPTPVSSGPARVGGTTGITTPHGVRILDFKANNPTWQCNWFPTQERTHLGGDPRYNLYAMDGALHKLDLVTGSNARDFEYSNHRKQLGAGPNYLWWGNCDKASTVACIFKQPKRAVTMKAQDGSTIVFTPNDVQGLLVRAVSSMTASTDFKGQRCNDPSRDDPMEPRPNVLIDALMEWCNDGTGLAQAWDIDPTGKVWNYPYDTIQIDESDKPTPGFDPSSISGGGSVKYYHIHASGNGYPDQVRDLAGYVQKDASGAVISSNWIFTPETNKNIDFIWRPHPVANLYDKSSWVLRGKPENPNIDMGVIYDIYMKSIA